ncbi:MAG: glycoside-pentoside-hexuronide (GPH):cation symporter [Oscillospiraceae bacterium]|jgi:melibiose permease|nr:glycoside-pentoside-hexuronide (GPH):cation symporter [Oscillospiraceae bacterium]
MRESGNQNGGAEQGLTWATKINYGIGAVGKSLSNGLSGRLQYYLLTVLRIDRKLLAPLLVAGRVWDGVNDLMMGAVIDNTRSRWGKFRPWIALGAVTNAMVMIGLFGAPAGLRASPAGLFGYIAVLWLLWDMTYTMVDVAYYAMIPALSGSPKERDQIAMIPRVFSGLLGVVTSFNMQVIDYLGGGDEITGFFRFAVLTSVVYITTSLYSAALVREPRLALPSEKKESIGIAKAAKILIHNRQALVVLAVMLLFNLAANMTNGVSIYYFRFVVHNDTQLGFFGILLGISQGVGLLGFPLLTKRFPRKKVYLWSYLLPCLGYGAMAAANLLLPGQFIPLMAAAFVGFIGYGFMSIMQSVMLADAVDYGEYETGERNEGIIFSTLTMLSKLAGAANDLVTLGVFSIVHFGGQDATTATPAAVRGIAGLMYVFPPVVLVASYLIYRFGYRLTAGRMEEVRAAIAARRAQEG